MFCTLKVNWKDFLQKKFAIHFTCSEWCTLSKVNCKQRKSIGTQNKWIGSESVLQTESKLERFSTKIFCNSLYILVANHVLWVKSIANIKSQLELKISELEL